MKKIILSIIASLALLSCNSDESVIDTNQNFDTNQNLTKSRPPGVDEPTIPIDMGGGGAGGNSACMNGSRVIGDCDSGQFNGSFHVDCAGKLNISGSYSKNSNGGMDISNFQTSYTAIVSNPSVTITSTNKSYISSNNWVIITVNYKKTTMVNPLPPQTGPATPVITNHNAAFYLKPCNLTFN